MGRCLIVRKLFPVHFNFEGHVQYCAKVMQMKFVELWSLFSRNFEQTFAQCRAKLRAKFVHKTKFCGNIGQFLKGQTKNRSCSENDGKCSVVEVVGNWTEQFLSHVCCCMLSLTC